jgi:hypothetical protein
MRPTAENKRRRLKLDEMQIDRLLQVYQNHRHAQTPTAAMIREAIAHVLEERKVEFDVLKKFLRED